MPGGCAGWCRCLKAKPTERALPSNDELHSSLAQLQESIRQLQAKSQAVEVNLETSNVALRHAAERAAASRASVLAAQQDTASLDAELAEGRGGIAVKLKQAKASVEEYRAKCPKAEAAYLAELHGTSPWQDGHDDLVSRLQADCQRSRLRRIEQDRYNSVLKEDIRSLTATSTAMLALGTREAYNLDGIRTQNRKLVSELEQSTDELDKLQVRYWHGLPYQAVNMDRREFEALLQRAHESDEDVARLERDLRAARESADEAASEAAIARAAVEAAALVAEAEHQGRAPRCPKRHTLKVERAEDDSCACDKCSAPLTKYSIVFACRLCNYAECEPCYRQLAEFSHEQAVAPRSIDMSPVPPTPPWTRGSVDNTANDLEDELAVERQHHMLTFQTHLQGHSLEHLSEARQKELLAHIHSNLGCDDLRLIFIWAQTERMVALELRAVGFVNDQHVEEVAKRIESGGAVCGSVWGPHIVPAKPQHGFYSHAASAWLCTQQRLQAYGQRAGDAIIHCTPDRPSPWHPWPLPREGATVANSLYGSPCRTPLPTRGQDVAPEAPQWEAAHDMFNPLARSSASKSAADPDIVERSIPTFGDASIEHSGPSSEARELAEVAAKNAELQREIAEVREKLRLEKEELEQVRIRDEIAKLRQRVGHQPQAQVGARPPRAPSGTATPRQLPPPPSTCAVAEATAPRESTASRGMFSAASMGGS